MIARATDLPERARCGARPKCRRSVDGDGEYRDVVVVKTGWVQTLDQVFDEPLGPRSVERDAFKRAV